MSAKNLPKKNEEYGTKEYWCAEPLYTLYVILTEYQESQILSVWRSLPHNTASDSGREADGDFDWFKSYADLAPIMHDLIPDKSSRILMLGCGNSKLSEEVGQLVLGKNLGTFNCADVGRWLP